MAQRRLGVVIAAGALLGACQGTDDPGPVLDGTAMPSAVASEADAPGTPPTDDEVARVPTPPPTPPSLVGDEYGSWGPTLAVAPNPGDGTAGSGCTPGDPDGLPDGVWMVDLVAVDPDTFTIDVDLLCYRTVQSVQAVDPDDGVDMIDFEITNDSPATRTLPVGENPNFLMLDPPPIITVGDAYDWTFFALPDAALAFAEQVGDPTPMGWIWVEGGVVLEFFQPALISA